MVNDIAVAKDATAIAVQIAGSLDYLHRVVGPVSSTVAETLANRVQEWVKRNGLTCDDIKNVCRAMIEPETMAAIRYPNDVLVKFSEQVALILDRREREEQRRRQHEDVMRRRKEDEQAKPVAGQRGSILSMLDGIGRSVGGERGSN